MVGKCKFKDTFDYCVVSRDTADFILDRMGFGQQKCAETNHYDGRYGYWDQNDHTLKYGYANSMHGVITEGKYVVFGIDDPWSRDVYTENEFREYFEVIDED